MVSPELGRRYLLSAFLVLSGLIGGVYLFGYAFLSADYLAWYFPFHGYPQFSERGYFVDNHGLQDAMLVYYTHFTYLHQQLQSGLLPLWNPLEGLGMPTAALHGNGYLFPVHWITYGLFSPLAAWHCELLLVALLNVASSFFLFQRLSGSTKGAMLGSTAWTLGGWSAAYFILPTYAWCLALYPTALLAVEMQREEKKWSGLLLGLCVAGILLASHLQVTVPALGLLVAFILWRGAGRRVAMLLQVGLGAVLAAPHLLPLLELLRLSEREPHSLELALTALLIPREYLCMVFPSLLGKPTDNFYFGEYLASPILNGREHCVFVGVITLALAVLALSRTQVRAYRVLGGLTFFGLFIAGSPWLYGGLCRLVPSLLFLTPTRFLPFCLFNICFLCSLGWASLEKKPLSQVEARTAAGATVLLVGAALSFLLPAMSYTAGFENWLVEMATRNIHVKPPMFEGDFSSFFVSRVLNHFSLSEPTILLSLGMLLATAWGCWQTVGRSVRFTVLYGLLAVDLAVYFFTMNIPVPSHLVMPKLPDVDLLSTGSLLTGDHPPYRNLALGQGPEPNLWLPYGISNLEAYESVNPGNYRALIDALNKGNSLPHQSCVYVGKDRLPDGTLDLLGVNKLYNRASAWDERYGSPDFQAVLAGVHRKEPLRAFLLDAYVVGSRETAFEALTQDDFDPRARVYLEHAPSFASAENGDFRSTEPTSYSPHEVRFQLATEQPALLVLNDLYYPGWQATVDGQPRPILQAYGFARAVELKPGDTEVVFRFFPTGFPYTPWLALLAFCALLGIDVHQQSRRQPIGAASAS